MAILFLINSPANKVGVLNARAEERRHFKVFPLECITELLSQTVANRDRQIEVVTQEADEKEREKWRRDEKAWRGASLLLQYSVALRRERRSKEKRGQRGAGGTKL